MRFAAARVPCREAALALALFGAPLSARAQGAQVPGSTAASQSGDRGSSNDTSQRDPATRGSGAQEGSQARTGSPSAGVESGTANGMAGGRTDEGPLGGTGIRGTTTKGKGGGYDKRKSRGGTREADSAPDMMGAKERRRARLTKPGQAGRDTNGGKLAPEPAGIGSANVSQHRAPGKEGRTGGSAPAEAGEQTSPPGGAAPAGSAGHSGDPGAGPTPK